MEINVIPSRSVSSSFEVRNERSIEKAVTDFIGDVTHSDLSASQASTVFTPLKSSDNTLLAVDETPAVPASSFLMLLLLWPSWRWCHSRPHLSAVLAPRFWLPILLRRKHGIELRGLHLQPRIAPVAPFVSTPVGLCRDARMLWRQDAWEGWLPDYDDSFSSCYSALTTAA